MTSQQFKDHIDSISEKDWHRRALRDAAQSDIAKLYIEGKISLSCYMERESEIYGRLEYRVINDKVYVKSK